MTLINSDWHQDLVESLPTAHLLPIHKEQVRTSLRVVVYHKNLVHSPSILIVQHSRSIFSQLSYRNVLLWSLSKAFQWREWWYKGTSQHRWSACSFLYISYPQFFLTKLWISFVCFHWLSAVVMQFIIWENGWILNLSGTTGSLTSLFHWSRL